MYVAHCHGHLAQKFESLRFRKRVRRASVEKFHYVVGRAVGLEGLVHVDDIPREPAEMLQAPGLYEEVGAAEVHFVYGHRRGHHAHPVRVAVARLGEIFLYGEWHCAGHVAYSYLRVGQVSDAEAARSEHAVYAILKVDAS